MNSSFNSSTSSPDMSLNTSNPLNANHASPVKGHHAETGASVRDSMDRNQLWKTMEPQRSKNLRHMTPPLWTGRPSCDLKRSHRSHTMLLSERPKMAPGSDSQPLTKSYIKLASRNQGGAQSSFSALARWAYLCHGSTMSCASRNEKSFIDLGNDPRVKNTTVGGTADIVQYEVWTLKHLWIDLSKGLENTGGFNFERLRVAGASDCVTDEISKPDFIVNLNDQQQMCNSLAIENATMACKE
jgi:hypothetical protein